MAGGEASAAPVEQDDNDIRAALSNLHDARSVGAEGGIPYFIRGELGRIDTGADARLLPGGPRMQESLRGIAPAFRLRGEDLVLSRVKVDERGHSHLRFQQFKNGLKVVGGELILHADTAGLIYAANGSARDGAKAAVSPALSEAMAVSAAVRDLGVSGAVAERPARLVYLLGEGARPTTLTYEVHVTGDRGDLPADEQVYVDAETGARLAVHSRIHTAMNRQVYSANNGTTLPGTLRRSEGSAATGDSHVDENFGHLNTVYQCYFQNFGRDSFDNAGAPLRSTVHYSSNYVNAYWNGAQLVYGDGDGVNSIALGKSRDVTAHELTHAVTERESNLVYANESGALSESLSDIFSAYCEAWAKGWSIDSGVYMIGDDVWTPSIPNDALRYMSDPMLDGESVDYYPNYSSGTDVHYGSGIPNLAFYLLAQGGTHPRGKTTTVVTGIGIQKAGRIFYWANTNYFTTTTTLRQARLYTVQAAQALGYDAATTRSVENAWTAVGVSSLEVLELVNGVPLPGLGGAPDSTQYAYFDVPSQPGGGDCLPLTEGGNGAFNTLATPSKLTITSSGGTGNADLYVKFDAQPTLVNFDCRSMLPGNEETCTFPSPSPGRWYVMLHGKNAFAGVSLKATYTPATYDTPTVNMKGSLNLGDQNPMGPFCVIPGTKLTAVMTGTGDPDLYVRWNQPPTLTEYDCRPYRPGASESCLMTVPAGVKRVYLMVRGYAASTYDLTLTYNIP